MNMGFEELFQLLKRAPDGLIVFNQAALRQYPQDLILALQHQNIIQEIGVAESLECPGCEQACNQYVNYVQDSEWAFILCDGREDTYSIPIAIDQLKQWQMSRRKLYETLSGNSGLEISKLETLPIVWRQALLVDAGNLTINTDYLLGLYSKLNRDDLSKNSMRLEGDYWVITYANQTKNIKNSTGIKYIEYLVRHKGKSISAPELQYEINPKDAKTYSEMHSEMSEEALEKNEGMFIGNIGYSFQEIIDTKGINEINKWIKRLTDEMEVAAEMGDTKKAYECEAKIDEIRKYRLEGINYANGHKISKKFKDSAEKARQAISKSIKEALKGLEKSSPELADHFSIAIKTGRECQYNPHPDVIWEKI